MCSVIVEYDAYQGTQNVFKKIISHMHRKIKYNMEYHHGKINNTDITEWLSLRMPQVGGATLRGCFTEAPVISALRRAFVGARLLGPVLALPLANFGGNYSISLSFSFLIFKAGLIKEPLCCTVVKIK